MRRKGDANEKKIKKGKTAARRAWNAAIKAGAAPWSIIAGAQRYSDDLQAVEGFAPDPDPWLKDHRWRDEVEPTRSPAHRSNITFAEQNARLLGNDDPWRARRKS